MKFERKMADSKMADFKVPDIIPFHKRKNVADSESSSSGSEINNKVQSAPKQEDSSQTDDENEVLSKVPYNEPSWSGLPSQLSSHVLSVIKRGVEIDSICLDKRYHIFGRLPVCDIHLEHPSISRYHAVLQYRPVSSDSANESVLFSTNPRDAGYYIYDLGSTHGTFLNKNKVQPFYYYRVRVGQTMKFGGSSRIFVLEQLDHAAQNIVELEAKAEIKVLQENSQLFAKAEADRIMKQNYEESLGATWGLLNDMMGVESDDSEPNESFYIDDPKKALKNFYDREGLELEYETEEATTTQGKVYTVKVRLPTESLYREQMFAEASQVGNKKEAVVQCAMEACRILDAEGVLKEPLQQYKRKVRDWEENDYYDSDEDNFFDRTGDVDKKRKIRMKRIGKITDESVETYKSLKEKLTAVEVELNELHNALDVSDKGPDQSSNNEDSLEFFMKNIKECKDKRKKIEIKMRINKLNEEKDNYTKLLKIAQPCTLPTLVKKEIAVMHIPSTDISQNDSVLDEQKDFLHKQITQHPQPIPNSKVHSKEKQIFGQNSDEQSKNKNNVCLSSQEQSEQDNECFSSWLPPEDQSGDGMTHLNRKFGY